MNHTKADPNESVREFWKRRLAQHMDDTYRGRRLAKMPEDLRTYQHVIEDSQPTTIVELGTYQGGSALWFADQLSIFGGKARVVTVDIAPVVPLLGDPRIHLLTGDLADPKIVKQVYRLVKGQRVMVVDDSAHTHESTGAALRNYADLVSPGCWFVVEDGIVDDPDLVLDSWHTRGVQPAVEEFLAENPRFVRHEMAMYGLTTDIGGWLQASK